jgi:alpha-N-arabinofuranosidase
MERNSDLVLLSSYAPLFVNVSDLAKGGSMQWRSDLLGYDALTSYGSPSYYAQAMFSSNHGEHVLATDSLNVPTYTTRSGRQVPSLFFDATRDSQSGTIFLKIVNRLGSPQSIHVKITGANNVNSSAEAVVMSASSPDDTNSIQEPTKIIPVTSNVDGLSADFTRAFPPFSITILKVKSN